MLGSFRYNDGCAIARTQEAKDLGVKMGAPWFQIKHLAQTHGLLALSANFSLYGDLSQRMMNVIGQFSPLQEIYSIDESFLDLTGVPGTGRELGSTIRERVKQWVGIPTCVGIGPSKTLAKLANHRKRMGNYIPLPASSANFFRNGVDAVSLRCHPVMRQ